MEDGLQWESKSLPDLDHANNGVASSVMANFPEGTVADTEKEVGNHFENSDSKFNGSVHSSDEADNDSDADALVIDESVPKRRIRKRKLSDRLKSSDNCEGSEVPLHSNPYFNQSLFELSQLSQSNSPAETEAVNAKTDKLKAVGRSNKSKRFKTKSSPKLHEYAQYLGLQPAVQFKCSRCRQAGFETLISLNEHLANCTADPSTFAEVEDNSTSSFKLTRKVFLCSACGTYYENWNLYMHMLEYHRRFICLYCLGMFSVLDDLCQHIQSRHNWEPQQLQTPADFFKDYKEPCFIICCECKKLFNEQDNFFYHNCVPCDNAGSKIVNKNVKNKCNKQQITPENHVTGDSVAENSGDINCIAEEHAADDQVNSAEMVRSEVNVKETSEVLPEVPELNTKIKELESIPGEIGNRVENSNSYEKNEQIEKQDSDVEGSLSMETMEKQDSSNVTAESSNDEAEKVDNSDKENINSPTSYSERHNFDQSSRDSDLKSNEDANSDSEEHRNEEIKDMSIEENMETFETRKVPKLSLKLSKLDTYSNMELEESDDSDKIGMEVDQIESENECLSVSDEKVGNSSSVSQIQVAGPDVSIIELELEQPLDKFDIKILLQKCLLATVPTCVYCNHARKIAVNGKQLGLHAMAQHRYSAVVKSITEEELIPESFVNRIKESLQQLETTYFNLESNLSEEAVTFSHVFECFQCRYSTNVHKELYMHNRKMHTKNLLLCIMCKSNFYSYSELICHLCPGDYVLDHDIQYRCCMCVNDDLPSAFRLMVHLRKRHHECDVCLEMCHNQYKLSNHVWKHKLHHFCYRCGIAYRNKQDITRHLFWKHGTESVLCKKCLQKKWPHVFHFCIPPAVFTCDDCGLNFTKAVYLKVHKRIHTNETPHSCTFEGCQEKFISKKLLQKHEKQHYEVEEKVEEKKEDVKDNLDNVVEDANAQVVPEEKPKPKVDVYDLPELNLSESSDSESEIEAPKQEVKKTEEEDIIETLEERTLEVEQELANSITVAQEEQNKQPEENLEPSIPILESIWDDFKIYQAKREKIDNLFGESDVPKPGESDTTDAAKPEDMQLEPELTAEIALQDHDYCCAPEVTQDSNIITETEPDLSERVDHDYCTPKETTKPVTEEENKTSEPSTEIKKAENSDDSSSDSDSSSCSCGSNCSCSSDSSSSSSSDSSDSDSSTEEGRKRQQARRDNKNAAVKKEENVQSVPPTTNAETIENDTSLETPILETDLETTESETDEEFYDKQPQKLAKKLLEEKRNQILAEVGSLPNGNMFETSRMSTPSLPEEVKHKKKLKTKKRKKKKSERKETGPTQYTTPTALEAPYQTYTTPVVAPLTISLNKMSPMLSQQIGTPSTAMTPDNSISRQDSESNLRASKRRRVPNKFYGYSSDEEGEKSAPTASKWKKLESPQIQPQIQPRHSPQLTVPPITIKTGAASLKQTVEPIMIRQTSRSGELRVHQRQSLPLPTTPRVPPLQINTSLLPRTVSTDPDSDSNESATEDMPEPEQPPKVPVYCYCKCPYDEVSEMIGCDSHDCEIEWFHFECVGIMVPPKGQWFCPECRKKKQRRELMNT